MHLNAKPPIFAPRKHWHELETMSKAALIDLVWDFAASAGESIDDESETLNTLRERARIILLHRGDRCQLRHSDGS